MSAFAIDMQRAHERLAGVPTSTMKTRWGAIQFVDDGGGVPILFSHGVLGGYDNIRVLVDLWFGPEYRAIGPCRFGYLGSALPERATPADQADAFAALLDHLAIDRVVAVGISAGGPSAIQLALRHPDRLYGLILGSAYLPGMAKPLPKALHPPVRAALGWEFGWWLLKTRCPALLARIMGVPKGWDASTDAHFLAVREALFPVRPKKRGIAFDVLVSEPASNGYPLEDIRVPTLLVHSADDRLAPYDKVPSAGARIPGARLVTIDGGGHLFLAHAAQVREVTSSFINEVVAVSPRFAGVARITAMENSANTAFNTRCAERSVRNEVWNDVR